MKLGLEEGRKASCVNCPSGARERELEDLVKHPRSERKRRRDEIVERHRCVASCDKTTVNTATRFATCGRALCAEHVAAEPQPGHHRCREHVA
jgi:hypothetical protein